MSRSFATLTDEPIDVAALAAQATSAEVGAVVTFAGTVRNHDGGREVSALEYSAHPSTAATLTEVARDAARHHDVIAVALSHRIGALSIGDVAVGIVVVAAHRGDAFDACRWTIDEVKRRTPIWKHQQFSDGTSEWVNCP